MTNSGMFEDAEKIEYLENQNKLLKQKLKEAVSKIKRIQGLEKQIFTLKKDIEILREGNEHLGIYRQN